MISAVPFGTMGYTQTIVQNYDSHVDLCSTYTSIPLDFQLEHRIEVYPIPFSDNLNISGIHPIGSLRIYNILGKIVLESKTKTESMNFNTQMLKSGIYILNYTNGAVQSQLKLIKN